MPVKMIPPTRIQIDAQQNPDGTWTLEHREHFPPEHAEAAECAAQILRNLGIDSSYCDDGEWRATYPNITLSAVGNVVCAEFMQWSPIGALPLRDLLGSLMARTTRSG